MKMFGFNRFYIISSETLEQIVSALKRLSKLDDKDDKEELKLLIKELIMIEEVDRLEEGIDFYMGDDDFDDMEEFNANMLDSYLEHIASEQNENGVGLKEMLINAGIKLVSKN